MMQTQTQVPPQVPPALEMLMSMGAQPTAPGPMGQPIETVAMQKAMQQGLPQMAMAAGQAAPSVMRNMEMQKIQQMLQQALQAQQQSPGIAGLPAPNMQRMADGGVVGYSGEGPSFVQNLSDAEIERLTPEQRKAYYKELLSRRNAPMPTSPTPSTPTVSPRSGLGIAGAMARKLGPLGLLAELFTTSDEDIAVLERAEAARKAAAAPAAAPSPAAAPAPAPQTPPPIPAQPVIGNAPPMSPEAQAMVRRQLPSAPRAEAPARTSAAPAAAAPAAASTGIAAAMPAAMTPEEAMASARAGLGVPGTADLRAAIMEAKQAREQMPATGQAGLAALQQQMDAVKRMEEERKRSMASERVIAQLLGRASEGLGGGARADVRFMAGQRAAEDAFYERNVALAAKQDAINDANAARSVGNKEKYVEAMQKLSDAERAIAQAEATYAAAILQNAGTVRGQNVQIQEGALDRAQRERDRQAQAALRNLPTYEQQMAQRVMDDYIRKNPGATLSDAWTFYRGTGKPDRTVMTYDQAADNVSKFLDTTSGMMEVSAIRKRAKDAGQPEPSLSQIRDMLIQRELQSAGGRAAAAPTGAPAALPPGVTVKRIGQ